MQETNLWMIGSGLVIGILFGILVQRSRMCTLAAVSNWVLMRDLRQIHGYLAALAVAVFGVAILNATGLVQISTSIYLSGHLNWFGAMAGGVVFGIGTVIAGGCAGRLLVRSAEGSGSALVAIGAVAIGSSACAYGVIAPLRTTLSEQTAMALSSSNGSLMTVLGLPHWLIPFAVVLACLLYVLPAMRRNESTGMVMAGAGVGGLVVAGWFATGYLARDEFAAVVHRPTSMTFAGPLGRCFEYFQSGNFPGNDFYYMLVIGVLGGAFVSALAKGNFRWSMPSGQEMLRVSTGGLLMGIGAVFAGGCNIGQGLTGMSTLSVSSLLAFAGILGGMRLGLAWLMREENDEAGESTAEYQKPAVNEAV